MKTLFVLCFSALASSAHADTVMSTCDEVYRDVVFNGFVDYERLAKNPARVACRDAIARADLTKLSLNDQLAFWANAYNLLTMIVVAEDQGRWSPQQSGDSLFRDRHFIVAGKELTLDQLEHQELARLTKDPRVEFLLSCGSRSCSLLPTQLVAGDGVEAAMELGAKRWFARRDNLRVNEVSKTVELGQLLAPDWHGGDFTRAGISLVQFVARFLPEDAAKRLKSGELRLVFRPYDWRINRVVRAYPLP